MGFLSYTSFYKDARERENERLWKGEKDAPARADGLLKTKPWVEGPALPADGFPMAYPPSCHQDSDLGALVNCGTVSIALSGTQFRMNS